MPDSDCVLAEALLERERSLLFSCRAARKTSGKVLVGAAVALLLVAVHCYQGADPSRISDISLAGQFSAMGRAPSVPQVAPRAWQARPHPLSGPMLQARASDLLPRASSKNLEAQEPEVSRRGVLLGTATAAATLGMAPFLSAPPAFADTASTVVVAGATGQTGRRVLERLAKKGGLSVVGGVRDVGKAEKTLKESSVAVRGAMLEKVPSVDTSAVTFAKLDCEKESVEELAATLKGAQALILTIGFVPGNPFKMGEAAHAVDNVGTVKLVDAAKAAGVSKVIMMSSILTDAGAWNQRDSAGFKVTNAFGNVLDEKLVAEKYLRASGLDYTIVRPGGLTSDPPKGELVVAEENTVNQYDISRDLVADVIVGAVSDSSLKNKVIEIYEKGATMSR